MTTSQARTQPCGESPPHRSGWLGLLILGDLVLLDADLARRTAAAPGIAASLIGYAQRSTQWLLTKSLLLSSRIIEERIMLLFALLGKRWGTGNCSGVRLALPLTVGSSSPMRSAGGSSGHSRRAAR